MTEGTALQAALHARYQDAPKAADLGGAAVLLESMAARGSCRDFRPDTVPTSELHTLCAVALASPTKSDLQQRDIVLLTDPVKRAALSNLLAGQAWVAGAPALAVFCGNNRRQRLMHAEKGIPFANDHLDAFFNAAVDAGIALAAFVTAAEAAGFGCCPISAVRNRADAVSDLLQLPDHVFPVAGLAIGYPKHPPSLSMRLPLSVTVHENTYAEDDLAGHIRDYDAARAARQPYASQRYPEDFGEAEFYGWSDDKVRQYSRPERAEFGAFVKRKGFRV